MANIDDKLTYLSETKNIFKNSLNSLGATITSSTTFRNYLTWLDTFYGEVSDKTDISENGVVGRTSQDTILPSEYTQVDYIESSGTQYIDTGVNADNKLDIKYKVEKIGNSLTTGAIYNNNGSYTRYHIGINSNKYSFYILNNSTHTIIPDDTNVKHEFYIKATNRTVLVDGVTYKLPIATSTDTNLNFWIFRRNSNASNLRNFSSFKLYSCSMYYNNALVRDFIPCYRNSDNEVGLYDLVNDVFYTNQGTGAFTYGSVVSIPNPDHPQPINNLTGNVSYKITTQNGEQTFNIPLGNIELCNIDTPEDKIYSSNGKFYLEKNIGKVILDGSGSYSESAVPGTTITNRFRTSAIYPTRSDKTGYCDNFRNRPSTEVAGDFECLLVTNDRFYFQINIDRLSENTTAGFKSWLSTHNTIVYYVLQNSTTTEITQENYPLLYNALKQIQDYLTAYKINKEFILGYSSPEIEY